MNQEKYGTVGKQAEHSIGFFLTSNFSMLPFVSALEPLRIANRMARKPLYRWSVITEDGRPALATNGLEVAADYSISDAPDFAMLFVAGPHEPSLFDQPKSLDWIVKQSKRGILIGGIETGTHLLARAKLLDNITCTTHWENIAEFNKDFPNIKVTSDVYEIGPKRVTCAGGSASTDLMLYIIEKQYDHELSASVADVMIHPQIRHANEPQRMDVESRTGVTHPVLIECIELMESNVEQPLSPQELAHLVGVSKRQLERLFRQYTHSTPARYYLTIRLQAARQLLEKSAMKIIDIAIACGFKSAGHFSSRYYSSFGITPRQTRKA